MKLLEQNMFHFISSYFDQMLEKSPTEHKCVHKIMLQKEMIYLSYFSVSYKFGHLKGEFWTSSIVF